MADEVTLEKVLEKTKQEIHSLLCLCRRPVPSEQLLKEYKEVCGDPLPYRKLGFNNINDLVKSIPDTVVCSYIDGNLFVQAASKNEAIHINRLVKGQKAPKKVPRMIQAAAGNRKGAFVQGGKSGPLLTKSAYRAAAPWNVPNIYRPPALRNNVVTPLMSTNIRQPMLPRPPQNPQKAPLQQVPPSNQQKMSNILFQAPITSLPPAARGKPTIPPLQISKPNTFYHRERLQRFVNLHRLGEIIYEDCKVKAGMYIASVIIDKKKSSCYPDEFKLVEDAYEKAAEVALSEWESKYQETIKKLPVTKDNNLMASRAVEILRKSPNGCWSEAFVKTYSENYGELLPEDWVQRVQSVTDELVFASADYQGVVFQCAPTSDNFSIYMAPPKKVITSPNNESISELLMPPAKRIEKPIRLIYEAEAQPVPVQYPDSNTWTVHVVVILSGDQIGVRRVDNELYAQWEELTNEMELFYGEREDELTPVGLLEPNRLYAAQVDSMWVRAELISYTDDGYVEMSLVDYADVEKISLSSIFPLDARFCSFPCIGMKCHLYGLANFAGSATAVKAVIELLLNSNFIAHVVSTEPQVSLILYQPSSDREVNLNELILNQIVEEAPPVTLKVGPVAQNAVISYVSSACDVYMLRDTIQQNVVDALISLVSFRVESFPAAPVLTTNTIYLGRSEKHGWCRMRLYSSIPTHDGSVSVQLIDFGDMELVSGNTLRDLNALSPILARIPEQAVRVLLARVPPSPTKVFSDKAAKTLRQIAPPDLRLMVRVLEMNNNVPVVELFERLESGKLVTINASLEMDETLYRSVEMPTPFVVRGKLGADLSQRVAAMTLPSRRSSSSSSPSPTLQMERVVIPEPDIPPIDGSRHGRSFDVQVFNVSSPSHFYVHPLQTLDDLGTLMKRLQELCSRDESRPPLDVNRGDYFATLHSGTNMYRRIQVAAKFGANVQVDYVDYGELDVTTISALKALPVELTALPAQAIRAKLHGVKPADGDWSPQNSLFFKKIVDGKVFASYLAGVEDKTLSLHLIDVSGSDERQVAQSLIDSCHALPC